MAISINEQYPGKTAGVSTAYPYGKARNVTAPSDGTGTPWEAAIVNDDQGFKQALLQAASIIPSGVPDSATASQYLAAMQLLFAGAVSFTGDATQWSVKLKVGARTLCIKGGNIDYGAFPGEVEVLVTFTEAFPTLCATVVPTRKMAAHTVAGDGGALLIGTPTVSNCRVSLQTFNASSIAELRGFSWIAFGW